MLAASNTADMSSLRSMTPDDLLEFTDCNLDPLTETYGIGFYLEYLATWPHLCYVMESHDGRIEGYSKFFSSNTTHFSRLHDQITCFAGLGSIDHDYNFELPCLAVPQGTFDADVQSITVLAKIEASPSPNVPTALPYDPDTNKNPHYLPWHAHITALTVAPRARRLGHARKLTEVLEQQGDAEDAWFVDLFVRADNEVALKLYASMG